MTKILKGLIISSTIILSSYVSAATWQDTGTLASGGFPNPSCNVRLAAPTSNAGVFRYIYPVSKYQTPVELNFDFSNYTIPQLQDFFIDIPDNKWNSFYESYQAAQKKYPQHVAKLFVSVYKNNNYLVTSSIVNLTSGNQNISIGTPIPLLVSHPYIKIQQLCL
ncbi:hypothetical protein A7P54_08175 [Acinetobacter sp. Ac_3412]|uniref:hypothetical protein n=1 Tax=Acinetobacter sp. Ac_3412 TaxID=1848935 RepID=UPI00148FA1F3|nr:hypothetical protein [Acinetobacter sp. Ac_3412]NNP76395.1 hypothetical protein [Acinetobacter sp. Ac_3412]